MLLPVISEKPRRRIPKSMRRPADGMNDSSHSRRLGEALTVLDAFAGNRELSVADITSQTRSSQTNVRRILHALQTHGFVDESENGNFRIPSLAYMGISTRNLTRLCGAARPAMEALAMRFNDTASIAVLANDHIYVLESVDSFSGVDCLQPPGRVLPPHCSAMGKVITAFQDRADAIKILYGYGLPRHTDRTVTNPAALFREFEGIRKFGIGVDREESSVGAMCFAAAIRLPNQKVNASIGLSTCAIRMTTVREGEIKTALAEAALAIAEELSGAPAPRLQGSPVNAPEGNSEDAGLRQ